MTRQIRFAWSIGWYTVLASRSIGQRYSGGDNRNRFAPHWPNPPPSHDIGWIRTTIENGRSRSKAIERRWMGSVIVEIDESIHWLWFVYRRNILSIGEQVHNQKGQKSSPLRIHLRRIILAANGATMSGKILRRFDHCSFCPSAVYG